MSDFVTLKDLAAELGMDRSALRKKALRLNCNLFPILAAGTRGQRSLALTVEDAGRLREGTALGLSTTADPDGWGYFYAIQVVPDLDPTRVKFGFARDVEARLRQHQTAAPTASLLYKWRCRERWEQTGIDALSVGTTLLRGEVYTVPDLEAVKYRGNAFFGLLCNEPP